VARRGAPREMLGFWRMIGRTWTSESRLPFVAHDTLTGSLFGVGSPVLAERVQAERTDRAGRDHNRSTRIHPGGPIDKHKYITVKNKICHSSDLILQSPST
jgi:hypothetical protein